MCYEAYADTTKLCAGRYRSFLARALSVLLLTAVVMVGVMNRASAQSLNWEGQDGIFVTPLAYAVPSAEKGFGRPIVAYHFLDAGDVLGGFHQVSVTMGLFNRIEFGYTRDLHQAGTTDLSDLWSSGFNVFHGKVNFLSERRTWRPALSIGFVARTQVENVGGVIQGMSTNNADFYAVATKTITQIHHLPLVFNVGFRETNASLLGLAGNATGYQGRVFGAAAFALKGPGRSTILLASEVMQQPRSIQGLPGAVVPTTITYAVRIVPAGALPLHGWGVESPKLTIDLGVAQVANSILPGVNLDARHQFALGISYGF
jgi:Protein of unknown function (DUF3034)